MKKISIFFLPVFFCSFLWAQTWTGITNSNWSTASNWNPAVEPTNAGNVIIPGTVASGNWPRFSGNVTINSIDLQPGSQLDVNGFSLTINGVNTNINFIGTTLNNSSGTTDIDININTGIGGFYTFFSNNTVNDNIVVNLTGSNQFVEGYTAPSNHYMGNASFNINDKLPVLIAYLSPSQYHGNLTVNRTMAGGTSLFNAGAAITGNYTFSNMVGSGTGMGNPSIKTVIGGTINITANYATPDGFEMYRIVNQTPGGSINVQNSQGFILKEDTLIVTSLSITGYRGNQYGDLYFNQITGQVTIADDAGYGGGFATRIRNNVINGNSNFTINGSNVFIEADAAGTGNKYFGDVNFNAAGGPLYVAYNDAIQCSGNLTINRSAAGHTQAFRSGGTIGGDFAYTNNTAGNSYFGNISGKTSIAGKVNIMANLTTPGFFEMYWLLNQTNGGGINIQNSKGFNIQRDTLLLNSLSITGYRGENYADLYSNSFTGNVTIADDAGYGGGFATRIRNNVITGNSNFTINGSNVFIEADAAGTGNKYIGDVNFNAAGGPLYVAYNDSIQCSGNLSIIRSSAGHTEAFRSGGTIGGDFTYSNNASGNTYLGNITLQTAVAGRLFITTIYSTPGIFELIRVNNQTGGGNIKVQNSAGYYLSNNALNVNSVSLTGYGGATNTYLIGNSITGDLFSADDIGYSGGFYTYIRNNTIMGSTSITINGSNVLLDADVGGSGNQYIGNVTYTRTGGTIYVGNGDFNEYNRDITINAAAGVILGNIKFTGSSNTLIEQLGTQPIIIASLMIAKTGNGKVTLNDSVSISGTATFSSGHIYSSTANQLIFLDNANNSQASDISYVDGPVTKKGNDAFTFPVGQMNKIAPISISAPVYITDQFSAQYFMKSPGTSGYNTELKDVALHHISTSEYWLLDRTAGTAEVIVTLSWETSRSGEVNNMADLKVTHWNGSMWKDEGNGGTSGNNATGTIQTGGAAITYSPFTLASGAVSNPLPVHLVNFTGTKNNGQVALQWITENEMNCSHYEIERSADASRFDKIATISANGGAFQRNYSVNDYQPFTGISYYRLKIVDTDGRFAYSGIVKIELNKKYVISILPNPAKEYITITGADEFMQIQITDLSGKVVRQINKGNNNRFSIAGLIKGMYFLRLVGKTSATTVKIVVE